MTQSPMMQNGDPRFSGPALAELTDTANRIQAAIETVIEGKPEVIRLAITVLLATGVGWWTSRRLLRPLDRITDAAGEIAAGDLDTRVAREGDPDLDRLADSFNGVADAVQARIEREARFASDVSHELRSPITALAAQAMFRRGPQRRRSSLFSGSGSSSRR